MTLNSLLTISKMSQITGISRKNLIYYDSIDLLKPESYGENGYRYYSFKQIELCYVIVALKELNLPLAKIKEYLETRTPELGLELFNKQLVHIDSEIDYLVKLKDYLEYRVRTTKECFDVDVNTPLIQDTGQELFYFDEAHTLDRLSYDSHVILDFFDHLISIDAFVNYGISLVYLPNDIKAPLSLKNSRRQLILRCRDFDENNDQIIKRKGKHLVVYHQGSLDDIDTSINVLYDYAQKKNIILDDALFLESLWDEVITVNEDIQISKLSALIKSM